ncbi:putative pyrimidine 5'-nucleotidase [Aspergillus homomorphus CBS 101889]|uniref:Pyrimidine 5'-nucleotidase n=1 Tax=Aspergillus homomorphus (strain CBS 101889) TaxID=1450537 RepID=A0A395I0P8_ASPHC|nr:pyrimidine 5'-nucleotidase [Aspergillus homomorphus CBS 101889]RAL13772.1 pyrimidine 5'-nucleotidase [Aspergillus homomorphus CBS 101889]
MTTANHSASAPLDPRPVFFFDIDNCLYSRGCNIHDEMQKLINEFFIKHLSLNTEDAHHLHMKYYKEYGLAIEGLTRHHKIDPLEFNREVDDALPLDEILKPDAQLRRLLEDIDRSKVRLWLLTNAYVTHARRVVRLLQVEDLFEGVTFCDYSQTPLVCKPSQVMYEKAEREAAASSREECYFVDDSGLNSKHAAERGWAVAHLVEPGLPAPPEPVSQFQISSLEELRTCFPHLFKSQQQS